MSHSNTLTQNRPVQRQTRPKLTDKQIAWRAQVFRVRGWQSKSVEQTAMFVEMAKVTKQFEETAFPQGGAQTLMDSKLDPGKEFKNYMATLDRFEKMTPPRPKRDVEALKGAAQAYLDHFEDHSSRQKKQPQNITKRDACLKTLRDLAKYDQVNELRGLGTPPWDSETAMKAASLKTTLDFESLPPGSEQAEQLQGQNANTAFWFNKPGTEDEPEKTFLFKPSSEKRSDIDGFPDGAETMREALTGRTSDLLTGMTGVKFDVPETQVIKVDPGHFPPGSLDNLEQVDPTQPILGSLQQFAKTDGEMRSNDMAKKNQVAPEDCQKIAILDTITGNMDRHDGNLMMQGDPPKLVPIDHGLTFPPQGAVDEMSTRIGGAHNALLSIPGAHKPFSPEMLEAIDKISPEVVANGLKQERTTLDTVHGGATAKISDDAIEIARRSAMFLKLAAKTLSPAAVQIAMGQNAKRLFDPTIDDKEFTVRAQNAISSADANQKDWGTFFTLPKEQQAAISERLAANGWPSDRGKLQQSWLMKNMKLAMRVFASGELNPELVKSLTSKIGKNVLENALKTRTLYDVKARISDYLPPPDPSAQPQPLGDVTQELAQIKLAFPKETPPKGSTREEAVVRNWRDFQLQGGTQQLNQAITLLGLNGIDESNSRAYVENALATISDAKAMGTSTSQNLDDNALELALKKQILDYTQELAMLMPGTRSLMVLKAISKERGALNGPKAASRRKLEGMQTAALDRVRKDLRDDLKSFLAALDQNTRDAMGTTIQGWKGDIDSGTVKVVRVQINDARQQYNIPRT
jgi:Phosphatidylinositol 3- and 4-kinase